MTTQIKPFSSFGKVMTTHFDKLGSPLKTIKQLPTLESRRKRLSDAKFNHKVLSFIDVKLELPKLEPFDEYEALHTVMKHYYAGFSTNCDLFEDNISTIFKALNIDKISPEKFECEKTWKVAESSTEKKGNAFGALVDNHFVGGIGGCEDKIEIDSNLYSNQSIQSLKINGSTLVYGGRRSPHKPSHGLKVKIFKFKLFYFLNFQPQVSVHYGAFSMKKWNISK